MKPNLVINALRAQRDQALDACALLSADLAESREQIASLEEQLKEAKSKKKPQPA